MKKKNLNAISTIVMALVMFMLPVFSTLDCSIKSRSQGEFVAQTRTVSAGNSMDFNNYYSKIQEQCKDVKFEYDEEYNQFNLTATQEIPISVLENEEVVLDTEMENISLTYQTIYDPETNLVTLFVYSNGEVSDALVGCPFTKENGEVDVVFSVDDELIYLSELQDAGEIQNCGWFSRALKKIAKVAAVIAVTAVVIAVAAVVVQVAAPAVATVVAAVSTGAGAGAGAGAAAALLGTTATASIVSGAATIASTSLAVAATAAVVAGTAYVAGEIEEKYQVIENVLEYSKKAIKKISIAIATTITEITLDRKYYFAYLTGILNIDYSVSLNYLEAYFVLLESGLINATALGGLKETIKNLVVGNDVINLIENIKTNTKIKKDYLGIYTSEESDAAKLAYAAGGFFQGLEQSETHDSTAGSGYYYHFHDFTHNIHVWYGSPA